SLHFKIDIIFLDPPYIKGLIQPALIAIIEGNILNKYGIIIVEHDKNDIIMEPMGLACYKQKKYGNTILSFFRQEES
ncbi:MAG TPA: 16S rRNA (guanine(966)-N(2))-methyltransferase RsmD, partial [Eubacteriaceae bacterium]|nr:16S rRNA (guanine(966)-N(2))-methyltransferase RsmD [Eubacteriaceae bacterium]